MDQKTLSDLLYVAAFFLGGLAFAVGPFIISHLLAPRTLQPKTRQVYECGMVPIGDAWVRFGIVFYLYALIFLAFDVDVLFLFPVATAFDRVSAARGIVELVIFVGILSLAIIYAWKKGVFKWERKVYNPR